MQTLATLVADEVVWHVPGTHPMSGDIRGRLALIEWLASLGPLGFTLREHDVFASDEHVCALSYMGARRTGVEIATRVVGIFHFREGQRTERWFYPEDDEAWSLIFTGGEKEGTATSGGTR